MLRRIPKGNVTTYKELARDLGNPRLARAVGNWLRSNMDLLGRPCYKVVRSDGKIGGYAKGTRAKTLLLKMDGIKVENNKINLRKHLFRF